jgi:hypothetical protein
MGPDPNDIRLIEAGEPPACCVTIDINQIERRCWKSDRPALPNRPFVADHLQAEQADHGIELDRPCFREFCEDLTLPRCGARTFAQSSVALACLDTCQ